MPGPNGEIEELAFEVRLGRGGRIELLVEGEHPDVVIEIGQLYSTDRTTADGLPVPHVNLTLKSVPLRLRRGSP